MFRREFTLGNVVTIAVVFLAVVGTSDAVNKINGSLLVNRSVGAKKVKPNALGGNEIRESKLGVVPRAIDAQELSGRTVDDLTVGCPTDTTRFHARGCVELTARAPRPYGEAIDECDFDGRALPMQDELVRLLDEDPTLTITEGGEFVRPAFTLPDGTSWVDIVTDDGGTMRAVSPSEAHPFRCVLALAN